MSWINKITYEYLKILKKKSNYRHFNYVQNLNQPFSLYKNKKIINWSNNDYNNIIHNDIVKKSMIDTIIRNGCGSGGTRNISGSNIYHNLLEKKIARFHNKDMGLIFNSGYLANYTAIKSLGHLFKNAIIFSDEENHSSIINGIKASGLEKKIFNHNDLNHLEYLLKKYNNKTQKIIIVEAIYSMNGNITKLNDLITISKKYDCLTYLDEIHSIGVYGKNGAGLSEYFSHQKNIDIIMGGFGKGFGVIGGYIVGNNLLIDSIRNCGTGFIFTTSIPPHIANGIITSMDEVKKVITENQQKRDFVVDYFINKSKKIGITLIDNNFDKSHLQFINVSGSKKSKTISKILLNNNNHYVQNINFPTVPKGKERLRISLKPFHSEEMIDDLLKSIKNII